MNDFVHILLGNPTLKVYYLRSLDRNEGLYDVLVARCLKEKGTKNNLNNIKAQLSHSPHRVSTAIACFAFAFAFAILLRRKKIIL